MCIGLGGIIFLSCENKTIGAFLFSIGLFAVLVFGLDLYTGKVCNISYYKTPAELIKIWIGNLVGAVGMGLIASTNDTLHQAAYSLAITKTEKPLPIIHGLICGLCIAIAVKGYGIAESSGKYIAIIFGVMVFILCGSEHVVADMFYFGAARVINIDVIKFLVLVTVGNTLGGFVFSKIGG